MKSFFFFILIFFISFSAYSKQYWKIVEKINETNQNKTFFLISNNLDAFSQQITGIDSSLKRLNGLESLDRNITINHNPRERKDFNKIFFLTGYDIGKSLVPIFRSYLISTEFYSTTELFMGASTLKELNDFENVMIPVPNYLFRKISLNKDIKNIEDELNKALVEDLILAESIYQNNFYGKNVKFNSGMTKVNRGQCIERELTMIKVSLNS